MGISQSIENIMDGKDYQRGSIEKVGNRQSDSQTIQDEEITISRTSYNNNSSQLQLIEGNIEGRRSRGRPRNTWTTDITTTKGMKYYQLKRAAEDRKRWHGLVVNLVQEKTQSCSKHDCQRIRLALNQRPIVTPVTNLQSVHAELSD